MLSFLKSLEPYQVENLGLPTLTQSSRMPRWLLVNISHKLYEFRTQLQMLFAIARRPSFWVTYLGSIVGCLAQV